MASATRHFILCDFCSKRRPGLLWLGGDDWVECPYCVKGKVEVIQQECPPTGKIFIPGSTHGATINKAWSRRF